jgi:disulfide bond formation protein DsbB
MSKKMLWSTTLTDGIGRGLVVTAFVVLAFMAFSARADAASCWGDWCSGTDPRATGCDIGARSVASARIPGTWAYIELYWSPTCKTNWARVPVSWGSYYPWQLRAVQCLTNYTQSGVVASNATHSWTRQIYSPVKRVRAEWVGQPGSVATACG